tara:strand:+ start:1098 stop:2732 length:1635 start_codon:yes stop_codon:yes gene_type:complete
VTQYAYPDGQFTASPTSSWGGNPSSNFWLNIDETQPLSSGSDSEYITSTDDFGSSDTVTITIGNVSDPGSSASSHILYYRSRGVDTSGFGVPAMTVALVQGATNNGDGTVIASVVNSSLTTSFVDYSLVLSNTESGNITDYTSLSFRFTRASGPGMSDGNTVSQAYFATPDVPAADNAEFRVGDRVKETTTSTGTGTINLAGAVTGYQAFVSGIGDTNKTYYVIEDTNNAWEIGIGTVTDASPDTLSRDKIIANSAGTLVAITLSSGTHTVFCGSPARSEMSDVVTKTGTYTVTQADSTIFCDTTSAFTVTMPTAAAAYAGLRYLVKKITDDVNVLTISSGASDFEHEDWSGWATSIKLYGKGDFYELQCARSDTSGTYKWFTVNKYLRPHVAMITQTVAQTVANQTDTQVTFDVDTIEHGPDADAANNKITIKRAGVYNLSAYLRYTSLDYNQSGAIVKIGITPDGGSIVYYKTGAAANWAWVGIEDRRPTPSTSVLRECAVDDVITLWTYQDDQSSEVTLVNDGTLTPFADWRAILSVQESR